MTDNVIKLDYYIASWKVVDIMNKNILESGKIDFSPLKLSMSLKVHKMFFPKLEITSKISSDMILSFFQQNEYVF